MHSSMQKEIYIYLYFRCRFSLLVLTAAAIHIHMSISSMSVCLSVWSSTSLCVCDSNLFLVNFVSVLQFLHCINIKLAKTSGEWSQSAGSKFESQMKTIGIVIAHELSRMLRCSSLLEKMFALHFSEVRKSHETRIFCDFVEIFACDKMNLNYKYSHS